MVSASVAFRVSGDTGYVLGDPCPSVAAACEPGDGGAETNDTFVYLVQPGDTLSEIARRCGTDTQSLAAENGLRLNSVIRVGQRLRLPSRPAAAKAPQPSYYVVQKGDTLSEIGQRFGTTAQTLAAMNGMRVSAVLPVGKKLRVPAPGRAARATSGWSAEDALVETALRYRGVSYRWGGMTTRGMDCSGLVARVLNLHGIDAPHNSRALYKLGVPVAKRALEPGDLVFFNTMGHGISHVGMYIGEGKFVHASSRKGQVRVDDLTQGYYDQKYVGARRVDH